MFGFDREDWVPTAFLAGAVVLLAATVAVVLAGGHTGHLRVGAAGAVGPLVRARASQPAGQRAKAAPKRALCLTTPTKT